MIPGVEPLHISRSPHYAPGYFPKDKRKESWNFPFMESLERQMDRSDGEKENLIIHKGSEPLLCFNKGDPNKPERRKYQLKDHPKGFTSQAGGGKTALKITGSIGVHLTG